MKIEQLTEGRLGEAVALVDLVFPVQEQGEESAKSVLSASLNPEKYKENLIKHQISPDLKYWLAIDELEKVRGIMGLYRYEKDKEEAYWLGWFCVASSARGQGIGTELLQFSIEEVRKQGKKFLRLYTSNHPDELDSHRLYEKYGFKLVGEERFGDTELKKLYYELKLGGGNNV